jgi:hypothetical protein
VFSTVPGVPACNPETSCQDVLFSERDQECVGTPPILKVLALVEEVDLVDNRSIVCDGKFNGQTVLIWSGTAVGF